MAERFRPVDRDQQFLVPVDMRDWLPAGHLVWLVLDVVEQLDVTVLRSRYALGGVGRQAYDPAMLLALLVYGYVTGVRSSRAIERACHTDVAFRVICAQDVPDHTQIARLSGGRIWTCSRICSRRCYSCVRRPGSSAWAWSRSTERRSPRTRPSTPTINFAYYEAKVAEMTAEAEQADAAEDGRGRPGPPW